jgi:hypothetical protein
LAKLTTLANDDVNNVPLLPIRLPRRAAKSIAPIEFLFAAYSCFIFPHGSNGQLSKIISGMMQRARGEHSDLMMNTTVEKTLRNYVREMEILHPAWMKGGKPQFIALPESILKRPREADADEEEWHPRSEEIAAVRSRDDYLP